MSLSVVLGQIAHIQIGYQTRTGVSEDQAGAYSILRATDVDEDALRLGDAMQFSPMTNPAPYLVADGDVLVVARGRMHTAHLVEEPPPNLVASNSFYIVRLRTGDVLPGYLTWWFNASEAQSYFLQQQGRSTIPFLSTKALAACKVNVSRIETQERIAALMVLARHERKLTKQVMKRKEIMIREVCQKAVSQ